MSVLSDQATLTLFRLYRMPNHRVWERFVRPKMQFNMKTLWPLEENRLVEVIEDEEQGEYRLFYALNDRGVVLAKMLGADEWNER